MLRFFVCATVLLAGGCLMANPDYLGETEGGSAGLAGTGTVGTSAAQTGTSSGSRGSATASGDGGTTTTSMPGDATGSTGGDSSDGELDTTAFPEGTTGTDAAPPCPRADGLRVCLQFDVDQASEVVDESPNGYDVNIEGGGVAPSPWGGAFVFDGDARVEVDCNGECGGGPTITYEAWLRVEAAPEARSGVIDNTGILGMFITAGLEVRCVSQNGTAEGGALTLDTWTHVACVANEGTLTAYLDGDLVAEMPIEPLTTIEMADPLALGNDTPSFGDPLFGTLDRVRVWDVALTPAQIQDAANP